VVPQSTNHLTASQYRGSHQNAIVFEQHLNRIEFRTLISECQVLSHAIAVETMNHPVAWFPATFE
ncbi:MAG: hypothetical protein QOC83_7285, partial [Pseudonocardiales bacterium]|nr:hypothetical protein [Pseudonocardiales bacterium]